MHYPAEVLFDIETLVNVAQPSKLLLIGDVDGGFLDPYLQQKELLGQPCAIHQIKTDQLDLLWDISERFDVAIALNVFEHVTKPTAQQVLARLRDVLCPQYCICLPMGHRAGQQSTWQLSDLFSFALRKVAQYSENETEYALFKYHIEDYKNTPDWLNADNWANPEMWGKYWW